jgi:adenylate cyclase
LARPGGICVSRVVRDQVRDKLDSTFEDMGEQQVKNITRPVRAHRILLGEVHRSSEPAPDTPSAAPPAVPDKPSVAVLPLANMSNEPEQECLADGIAEDVITALSRYSSLFVIARNSCFTYKGRAVDVKQVGRELGVRYVLEGGLRKAGNRIRVTAQLVEAETGKHVWAERYDRDLADIFALQDEITEAVTIAIAPAIADAEQQRAMRKPPGSLDAWAAYQRGLWHVSKYTADDNSLAEKFFRQAIDLDPTFSGGYGGLAMAHGQAADFQTRGLPKTQSSMEALARRALALNGADAEARSQLSNALRQRGDYEGALAEAELEVAKRAIRSYPEFPLSYRWLAAALGQLGHIEEAKEALEGHRDCGRLVRYVCPPSRAKHQARPARPVSGPFEPDGVGTLLLPRIRGRYAGRPAAPFGADRAPLRDPPYWARPSVPLGYNEPAWPARTT